MAPREWGSQLKLLRITTSEDTEPRIPEELRVPALAARRFEAETGEPMEMVHRVFWPTPAFPSIVESWMQKYEPDMVFMVVSSYCFTYESVPLRIEHKLGAAGKKINAWSQKLASNHTISERATFIAARRLAQRAIGADANFTVAETLERTEAAIRAIVAHEGTVLAVRGPRRPLAIDGGEQALRRAERRRKAVNRRLREICDGLHVPCYVFDEPPFANDGTKTFGDIIHANAETQAEEAERQAEFLVSAWRGA